MPTITEVLRREDLLEEQPIFRPVYKFIHPLLHCQFTYDIPENGEGVPLGSPSEDGCFFDGWYYYRAFVVDERMAVHEQFLL